MHRIVFVSSKCEGIPLGPAAFQNAFFDFRLLPDGESLLERVSQFNFEQRAGVAAVVTLLTDNLAGDKLIALKALLPDLKLIAQYAVGYNNIDISVAKKLGIAVSNTPGVLGDATADLTLTLILMVARRIFPSALEIHEYGRFAGWSPDYGLGMDLHGKTLGIVGLGDIGLKVAQRARSFGMNVVALQSLRSTTEVDANNEFARMPEDEFLAVTDVLSLHCPLTPQTRGWLNEHRLKKLKKGAIVVNTARGDVVDETALADALQKEHLFGAGLDVFSGEPVVSEVLRRAPNLLVLPHLGSATRETRAAMGRRVIDNIEAFFAGRDLPNLVKS